MLLFYYFILLIMMEGKSMLSTFSNTQPTKQPSETQKKYILKTIHYLFIYYSAKASRYAFKEMSQKSYMELIIHAYQSAGKILLKQSQQHKQIITLFYGKGRRTALTFQEFLKTLPMVSREFSRSNSAEEDLKYLIKYLLLVYQDRVSKEIQQKFVQFDMALKQDTLQYILKLSSQLLIVYKLYFSNEINNKFYSAQRTQFELFQNILLFCKEFQVYPKIINASQLYFIFNQIINNQEQSLFQPVNQKISNSRSIFNQSITQSTRLPLTFAKFLDILVRIAITSISRLREVQNPEFWVLKQKESVKALFEYMQVVKGKNKLNKFKDVRFSLIPVEEYREQKQGLVVSQRQLLESMKNQENRHNNNFFELFEQMKL